MSEEQDEGSTLATPRSVRALQRYTNEIEKKDMSPSMRKLIAPLLKGSIAIATSEGLAYENLSIRTDAQKERA